MPTFQIGCSNCILKVSTIRQNYQYKVQDGFHMNTELTMCPLAPSFPWKHETDTIIEAAVVDTIMEL